MKSIISNDKEDICFWCGRWGSMHTHHIFGGPDRKVSDRYRLVVHLCIFCHDKVHGKDGELMMETLHRIGQETYEEQIGTREQFMSEFRRSYL